MKVLIIGGGGREHALAWKAAKSPMVDKVFVAPGNAGTSIEKNVQNVAIASDDFFSLAKFAIDEEVRLTIVGPEQPLADGLVDFFQARDLAIFGPTKKAAQLEASKAFTKKFLQRHDIPTGSYQIFDEAKSALSYVQKQGTPIVIKADGLAAGKGVVVANTFEEAENAIHSMLSENLFGNAGNQIVIEEFLEGEEASFIVMVDGKNILPMATSQDHKRVGTGDIGPNTGGMGAYSPAPVIDSLLHERIMSEIITPTVEGMADENGGYTGFLYAGLIITADGSPKVIEYNCRFGDPETQPILMRLQSDLIAHCEAALRGKLDTQVPLWDPKPAVGVVLASEGYPASYQKGHPISGLDSEAISHKDIKIFHAGTAEQAGKIVTDGGRVLCVTAIGSTISSAQEKVYSACNVVGWPGSFYRTDIAWRALKEQKRSNEL